MSLKSQLFVRVLPAHLSLYKLIIVKLLFYARQLWVQLLFQAHASRDVAKGYLTPCHVDKFTVVAKTCYDSSELSTKWLLVSFCHRNVCQ